MKRVSIFDIVRMGLRGSADIRKFEESFNIKSLNSAEIKKRFRSKRVERVKLNLYSIFNLMSNSIKPRLKAYCDNIRKVIGSSIFDSLETKGDWIEESLELRFNDIILSDYFKVDYIEVLKVGTVSYIKKIKFINKILSKDKFLNVYNLLKDKTFEVKLKIKNTMCQDLLMDESLDLSKCFKVNNLNFVNLEFINNKKVSNRSRNGIKLKEEVFKIVENK